MSKIDKMIIKILRGTPISYKEAESLLFKLGFDMESSGSHHVFRKKGYERNISLKKRPVLFPYQMNALQEVLTDHGY